MEPSPLALVELFLFGSSVEAIADAKKQLLSLGEAGAEAIASSIARLPLEPGAPPANTNHAIRLAELLVALESSKGLDTLLMLHGLFGTSWPQGIELIASLLAAMKKRASTADIATLLQVLEDANRGQVAERGGLLVAQTVVELAERHSLITLRPALALLKPGLSTPLEYFLLHRRLRSALGKESLPIPVTTSPQEAGLPIPAGDHVENEGL